MLGHVWRRVIACVACFGMLVPQAGLGYGEPSSRRAPDLVDVRLSAGGTIAGVVVDSTGRVVADSPVILRFNGAVVARTRTNGSGRYAITGLRGGVHQLQTRRGRRAARLWTPEAAPAGAAEMVVIVESQSVVRGQSCGDDCTDGCGECGECGEGCGEDSWYGGGFSGGMFGGTTGGLVIGGLLVGGVATAIAVAANDDDDPPASP